jgi:cold-inducible RNA-binding protein
MPVRLFVGNLSYDATEAELRQHFGTVGPVTYCYLPTDRETGRMRGFAFVEFGDDAHAHEAISRLNNQPFRGRPLAVKEAPYGGGSGAPRPFSGAREGGFGGPPSPAGGARREHNFGPDAPPKGKKKPTYGRGEQKAKGPIRTKTDGRIYNAFDDEGEEAAASVDFDDFATSREGQDAEPSDSPLDAPARSEDDSAQDDD